MTPDTARRTLQIASAILIGFGPIIALGAHPSTAGILNFFADLIFWPLDGAEATTTPTARLFAAVGGGLATGWGVTLWLLATRGLDEAPGLSLLLIKIPVLVWFFIDSIASVAAGAHWNVGGNAIFLVLFLWPVVALERRTSQPA